MNFDKRPLGHVPSRGRDEAHLIEYSLLHDEYSLIAGGIVTCTLYLYTYKDRINPESFVFCVHIVDRIL